MYRVQTSAHPRVQYLGSFIPKTGTIVKSPETCQGALNLFESQEQLGQAIQWYHNELWKLKQKKRE